MLLLHPGKWRNFVSVGSICVGVLQCGQNTVLLDRDAEGFCGRPNHSYLWLFSFLATKQTQNSVLLLTLESSTPLFCAPAGQR